MLLGWGFIISTAKESSQESALLHLFQNHIFAAVMPNTKIKTKKKKKLFKVRLKNILGGNANQTGAPRVSRWGSSSARTPNTWSLCLPPSCAHLFPCFSFQQSCFPTFSHTQTLAAWEPLRPYTPTLSRGDLPLLPSTRGSSPSLRMA